VSESKKFDLPMIMYHATPRANLGSILTKGLVPQLENHIIGSGEVHQDRIFLSVFSDPQQMNLPEYKLGEDLVILEVDMSSIDKKMMYPDDSLYWAYYEDQLSDKDLKRIFPQKYKEYKNSEDKDDYDSFGEYISEEENTMTDDELDGYLRGKYYITLPEFKLDIGFVCGEVAYKGTIDKKYISVYDNA